MIEGIDFRLRVARCRQREKRTQPIRAQSRINFCREPHVRTRVTDEDVVISPATAMPVPGQLRLFEWYSLNLRLGRLLILFGKGLPQANRYSRLAPVASRIFLLSAYRCRGVRRMRNFQLSCDARNGTLQGGLMLIVCFT